MEAPEWFCNLHTQITQQCQFFVVQGPFFEQSRALFLQLRPESCNYLWSCIFREQGHLKVEFGTLDGKFILGNVSTLLKA
jgi:hypothetical protein